MIRRSGPNGGGGNGEPLGAAQIPSDPTARLGFEIVPTDSWWSFTPIYYPDRFVQSKERDLKRDGKQCGGEDVSIEQIKNREFHASGIVLADEIRVLQRLIDYEAAVDLISPLTPDGGMECQIKNSELGEKVGFDPIHQQWQFNYTLDLVSTGRDEYDESENEIVSEIINPSDSMDFNDDGEIEAWEERRAVREL